MNYRAYIKKQADIKNVLKKRHDMELAKVTGYENYTPELMAILLEMHRAGKIESHPITGGTATITWVKESDKVDGDFIDFSRIHRPNNLPAIEYASMGADWVENGLRHRTDGPAIERKDKYDHYYLRGQEIAKDDFAELAERHETYGY